MRVYFCCLVLVLLLTACGSSAPQVTASDATDSSKSTILPESSTTQPEPSSLPSIAESKELSGSSEPSASVPVYYERSLFTSADFTEPVKSVSIGESFLGWRLSNFEEQYTGDTAIANFVGKHTVTGILSFEDVDIYGKNVFFVPDDPVLFPYSAGSNHRKFYMALDYKADYTNPETLRTDKPIGQPYTDPLTAFDMFLTLADMKEADIKQSSKALGWWISGNFKLENPSITIENFTEIKEYDSGTLALEYNPNNHRAVAFFISKQEVDANNQPIIRMFEMRHEYEGKIDFDYYRYNKFLEMIDGAATLSSYRCELELSGYRAMGVARGSVNSGTVTKIISAEKMENPQFIYG